MNIHTPFELLELSKKGVILQLKEKNIEYKINDNFIKYEEVIEELNLKCQVEIYYGLKKINSISLSYDFDNSLDNNSIFKQLEQVKNIYKEQFDVENYFDPKDGKSFFYTLCYKEYGIYLHGPSYCSNESEKYFGITYNKDIKCAKTVKNPWHYRRNNRHGRNSNRPDPQPRQRCAGKQPGAALFGRRTGTKACHRPGFCGNDPSAGQRCRRPFGALYFAYAFTVFYSVSGAYDGGADAGADAQ